MYWYEDILEKRQRVEHSPELEHSREENSAEELSVSNVKDQLKSLRVKTWLRNEKKLRELLKKRIEKSEGSN